ncbi:hypothetical protein C8J47_3543 [Sphingomonas sp. PP-F2F-G114-C0414]|nr:hypothetical protein C8J47_3543 [Sphingomonas sp. PP-F2F-G114-C0414]
MRWSATYKSRAIVATVLLAWSPILAWWIL